MTKEKDFPPKNPKPTFVECGQCGAWHSSKLPGSVDCRDDSCRFSTSELEDHYGFFGWRPLPLEDLDGVSGQDRDGYSDDQDRDSYVVEDGEDQ